MAEVKAEETTSAPPYGSPNPPPPGQPYNQQTAPIQPLPQQLLTVQPQPPPLTGVQYYTQAYPAVSGAGKYSEGRTCHSHSHYPSPHNTATGGPGPAADAHCGHTADACKAYRHQTPQVCLCDQRGGYNHLHSALLAARTPLSCTSHSHEYNGE